MLRTRSERLKQLLPVHGEVAGEAEGGASRFSWSPELDHVLFAHDRHLAPAFFVVGGPRVCHCQVVVGRDDAAYEMQRVDARFARKDLVLHRVSADPLVTRGHTARPQASSASRPAWVMRADVHGGSQTTFTRTSWTPVSRSSLSRTSSRMKSEAGHPIAVNVRSTSTTPSCSLMP